MLWRLLPLLAVALALSADALALHRLAGLVVVAAVVVSATAAVVRFGHLVDLAGAARARGWARADVVLAATGLLCVLVAAVARGHAPDAAAVADAAVPGLLAALVVYALQALAALVAPRTTPA